MKSRILVGATLLSGIASILLLPAHTALAQTAASQSALGGIAMPQGTFSFEPKDVPKEINDTLETMLKSGGDGVERGKTEVSGWMGEGYKKSLAPGYKAKIAAALKKAGWEYEEGQEIEGAEGLTMVSVLKTFPVRKALIGFWAPTDDVLLLAWTEMLAKDGPANGSVKGTTPPVDVDVAVPSPVKGTIIFELDDATYAVNVMKNEQVKVPTFTSLSPKAGYVRGYVKDSNGKPLANAKLGIRSTAVGGAETSASGKSDAKGYYEIQLPFGVAGFYNAGYAVDYGDGVAPLGLYPVDGQLDDFASEDGYVKNWVLLPYGIADKADLQTNIKYANNYFGGQLVFRLDGPNSAYGADHSFPEGSTLELTLTPREPLIDGNQGPTLVFRKVVREGTEHRVYLNNIPLSRYRISGRAMENGHTLFPLKFQETGPDRAKGFGLAPGDIKDSNELQLRPYNGRVESVTASHGHWAPVEIDLIH